MVHDELRADPFTWAFAKNHIIEAPRIQRRSRRIRRLIQLSAAVFVATLLSLFAASSLRAGGEPLAGLEILGDGSGIVEVYGYGSPDDIAGELAAILEDTAFSGVWIGTESGRPNIEGRLVHDGDGMRLIDSDPNYDNTATRIQLDQGATGPIFVMRLREADEPHRVGFELGCALAGMTWGDAERTASGLGYEIRVLDAPSLDVLEASYVKEVYTFGAGATARVVSNRAEAQLAVQRCVDDGRTVGLEHNPTPAP